MSAARRTALACAVLAAAVLGPAPPATAAGAAGLPELLVRLQTLYRRAEQATESYDGAKERLDAAQRRYDGLTRQLTGRHAALAAARDAAGAIAREQYRSGGVSPYMRLLLSDDPTEALSQAHVLGRAEAWRATVERRLRGGEHALDATAARAAGALNTMRALAGRERAARDRAKGSLGEVERAVASLSGGQLAALAALEKGHTEHAQHALLASGRLAGRTARPSGPGRRAVGYAVAQLGKPYRWGAQGPKAFDCSGLTSQAWDHAGRAIPRTSQEQWAALPKVPLDRVRPGDLIVYFPQATHVALYVGDGLVVQAPRPGAAVSLSPVAVDPVLGAVRPDAPDASEAAGPWDALGPLRTAERPDLTVDQPTEAR